MSSDELSASDPADLGIVAASTLLRSDELSAVELLAACQRRIAERNGGPPSFDGTPSAVNAWARLYPDLAQDMAVAADAVLTRDGHAAPFLCGIPVALKDLIEVSGLPVTASSRVLADNVATRDATVWARLAAAGMVLVGHAHTHEFAAGGTTDQVANPFALDRSAGGSSGGSAAALASGMVPAALGTDTAGSLRIPASLSGICSMKPTHGLVPIAGIIPLAPSLDHVGPMARSMADCGALLTALAAGGAEPTPLMPPPPDPGEFPMRASPAVTPLAGVTIALTDRPETVGVTAEVASALEGAVAAARTLGARIVTVPAGPDLSAADFTVILMTEVAAHHQRYRGPDGLYRTSILEFIESSRSFASAESYLHAQQRRARLTAEWEEWFAQHGVDVILEPTTPTTAPLRGGGYGSGEKAGEGDPLIRLTATWNGTGFPAASLPAGLGSTSNLPVGISVIGPRGADATVLQVAIDLQEHALGMLPLADPASSHA